MRGTTLHHQPRVEVTLEISITRNVDSDCVHVQLELRKDDLGKLITDGALTIDVPDVDCGEIKMTIAVQVNELMPTSSKRR